MKNRTALHASPKWMPVIMCAAHNPQCYFIFVEPLNDLLKSRTKQQIKQIQAYSNRNFSFCSYACTAPNGVLENTAVLRLFSTRIWHVRRIRDESSIDCSVVELL